MDKDLSPTERIAARLAHSMDDAGLTNTRLASACNVSVQAVGGWKRTGRINKKHFPTIARLTGKPVEWLMGGMAPPPDFVSDALAGARVIHRVPLISWVTAGQYAESPDYLDPGDAEDWLPCPARCSDHTYALRVNGPSMEPDYRDGEIIFVDPDEDWGHGMDVFVRTADGRHTFKRLLVEGDGSYMLQALNPEWPDRYLPLPAGSTVSGVVVGSFRDRRKSGN